VSAVLRDLSLKEQCKRFREISLKRVSIFSGGMERVFILHCSEYYPFKIRHWQLSDRGSVGYWT